MNIFYTHHDQNQAARYLDSKRVIKMTLETAQLLSTAMHLTPDCPPGPYKLTHPNHPCSIWVRANVVTYSWTLGLLLAYGAEYSRRYGGKVHKSLEHIPTFVSAMPYLPKENEFYILPPACVDEDLRNLPIQEAYRKQLERKWNK